MKKEVEEKAQVEVEPATKQQSKQEECDFEHLKNSPSPQIEKEEQLE